MSFFHQFSFLKWGKQLYLHAFIYSALHKVKQLDLLYKAFTLSIILFAITLIVAVDNYLIDFFNMFSYLYSSSLSHTYKVFFYL
jgi:hypothetical protein